MKCAFSLSCPHPAWDGTRLCQVHDLDKRARNQTYRQRRKAAKPGGECAKPHCTRPVWQRRTLCKKHVLESRAGAARRRDRLKARHIGLPMPPKKRGRPAAVSLGSSYEAILRRADKKWQRLISGDW